LKYKIIRVLLLLLIKKNEIVKNVKLIIENVLGVKIKDNDGLGTIEEWDSMAQLSILLAIENQCGIKFKMTELKDVTNLASWISITNKKI
tara:strand:- start:192 stop:461 length:270 start_codon:yes stop_codon:yes gene_type:complete